MKTANIALPFVVIVILLGLFFFRASQTKAYYAGEGKLPVIDDSKYSKEYLYKGRKAKTQADLREEAILDSIKFQKLIEQERGN